ncbi:unnamed protein product [Litomosoides sigmodontis]|uniref:C2H2-type domain-containing protein n=1 Tax=Litomosoides sigmodontis TaxID=42156 RepID=A0A3P6T942_LITSI|nr:unnamed protein product [Litomosoides sigmodontis]
MSMSDFLVQRILGLNPASETRSHVANERNTSAITTSKAPTGLQNFHFSINGLPSPMIDYATALQLMQLQMFCQPSLLNSFLNQVATMGLAMNNNSLNKVTLPNEKSPDNCMTTIRERKRAVSRYSDELPSKRSKLIRRLADDSETNSPVSGMFIKEASSLPPADELQAAADLDDTAVFVNVSEESRRNIERITNVIGDCICALCKVRYDDVFRLAQHRCPRIIHEEYRCPECDKVFSCPANLASHRRWHKPRRNDPSSATAPLSATSNASISSNNFTCRTCSATFDSKKTLKLHSAHCSTTHVDNSSHGQNHFSKFTAT